MSPGDDEAQAELRRKFQSAIAGTELSDLRRLAGNLSLIRGGLARPARPELRRPPRAEVATYRVRVDLDGAAPPIWRVLDLRSDLRLNVVHQVLQTAFDWTDSHLFRFSLGGHPFDMTSQIFLCPFDVDEGEEADDGAIPAADVRLDETLQEPGDVLQYIYDYGDSWELTLRLEEVLASAPDGPLAIAVDGGRAAPPENSGGGTDLASLAAVVPDPALFDLDSLNTALQTPYFVLTEHGVDQRLVELANRLRYTSAGEDFAGRLLALVSEPTEPDRQELVAALAAYRWFLDRAVHGGIKLTSAGYLKPDDVAAAAQVVPAMGDWIFPIYRERDVYPLWDFRESVRSIGLLRKHKGALLLTRAGAAAQRDPLMLWRHLATRLIPNKGNDFETVASLLLLAYAGTSTTPTIPVTAIANALSQLGWRRGDGQPLAAHDLYDLNAYTLLINVSDRPTERGDRHHLSPAAAALARAALRPIMSATA